MRSRKLRDRVDAVTVCTPNDVHGHHAELALTHGKHVFCEKINIGGRQ